MPRKRDTDKVVAIVRDAGGTIVGRTRLQKTAYLLELAGLGEGFHFSYRHYGPYSEELASAVRDANALAPSRRTRARRILLEFPYGRGHSLN